MTKQDVFDTINDLVVDFLYCDRMECEILPSGSIDKLLKDGKITIKEMAEEFKKCLQNNLTK